MHQHRVHMGLLHTLISFIVKQVQYMCRMPRQVPTLAQCHILCIWLNRTLSTSICAGKTGCCTSEQNNIKIADTPWSHSVVQVADHLESKSRCTVRNCDVHVHDYFIKVAVESVRDRSGIATKIICPTIGGIECVGLHCCTIEHNE